MVQARLNLLLQLGNGKRFVMQTALQELGPSLQRMHVTIDETRHQESSLEIHHSGCRADEGSSALVGAYINNAPVTNRKGFCQVITHIRGKKNAIAIDTVRWGGLRWGRRGRKQRGRENGNED